VIQFLAQLDGDPRPDLISIELYKGFGVFTTGIVPGTYLLAGAELNYATCGSCVMIFTNHDSATGEFTHRYFQTGGTLVLGSVSGDLTGVLSGASFETVTINPTTFESMPAGDGCETHLDSLGFDSPITIM
jgi:hypothetical protein